MAATTHPQGLCVPIGVESVKTAANGRRPNDAVGDVTASIGSGRGCVISAAAAAVRIGMQRQEVVMARQRAEDHSSRGDGSPAREGHPAVFEGVERRRFAALLALGAGLGAVVVIVAFVTDAALAWPLLVLLTLCLAVAFVYRRIAASNRDDADHTDSIPKQPATRSRALGDTPDAHDEVSPHDIPLYSPARAAAERQAGGLAGTTRGNRQGGAAGVGGSAADDERIVGPDEKDEARV